MADMCIFFLNCKGHFKPGGVHLNINGYRLLCVNRPALGMPFKDTLAHTGHPVGWVLSFIALWALHLLWWPLQHLPILDRAQTMPICDVSVEDAPLKTLAQEFIFLKFPLKKI